MQVSLIAVLLVIVAALCGCESSAPAARNIDAVYRFENLRKQTDAAKVPAQDEWAKIKPILDRASVKPLQVSRTGVRPYGSLELANYEARCALRSLDEVRRVQFELDSLAGSADKAGERTETQLVQITATYKSNFILATVTVGVSGATVPGHTIRIFATPGEPPVETTADASGTWSAHVVVIPETKWIYGLTEDPSGHVPTRYFRINAATRKQERVEVADFLKLFPAAPPAPAKAKPDAAAQPKSP